MYKKSHVNIYKLFLATLIVDDKPNLLNLTPVEVIFDENFVHVSLMRRKNKVRHPIKSRYFSKRKKTLRFLISKTVYEPRGQPRIGYY
jgi:hypothetical protein